MALGVLDDVSRFPDVVHEGEGQVQGTFIEVDP
jgi:hypothetical protein